MAVNHGKLEGETTVTSRMNVEDNAPIKKMDWIIGKYITVFDISPMYYKSFLVGGALNVAVGYLKGRNADRLGWGNRCLLPQIPVIGELKN
jgi:hypothetical protein